MPASAAGRTKRVVPTKPPTHAREPIPPNKESAPASPSFTERRKVRRLPAEIVELPRYKLSNELGLQVVGAGGFSIGNQFGYALYPQRPFFIGPAFNFSLLPDGYLLTLFAGTWYEFPFFGSPSLIFQIGALAGIAFAQGVSFLAPVNFAGYLHLSLVQELDDLVSVGGQFRPGYVGGRFAFMMNFNISFRFY